MKQIKLWEYKLLCWWENVKDVILRREYDEDGWPK